MRHLAKILLVTAAVLSIGLIIFHYELFVKDQYIEPEGLNVNVCKRCESQETKCDASFEVFPRQGWRGNERKTETLVCGSGCCPETTYRTEWEADLACPSEQ